MLNIMPATVDAIATATVTVTEVFRAERATPERPSAENLSEICSKQLFDLGAVAGERLATEAELALAEREYEITFDAAQRALEVRDYCEPRGACAETLLSLAAQLKENFFRSRDVRYWATLSPEARLWASRD